MKALQNPALIAVLAVLSGVGTGLAWFWRAATVIVTNTKPAVAHAPKSSVQQDWDFWTIEIENLTSELKGEKERLRKAMEQVDQRGARLTAEQQELDKLRAEVERMRKELNGRIIEIQADEMKNLKTLTNTYSALPPKAAVAILREMDDVTVVKILSLMKTDVVSPIFDEMSRTPDDAGGTLARRAAVLSERLRLMKANKPAAK